MNVQVGVTKMNKMTNIILMIKIDLIRCLPKKEHTMYKVKHTNYHLTHGDAKTPGFKGLTIQLPPIMGMGAIQVPPP